MNIKVNGDELDLSNGTTVRGLIEHLGLDRGPVAVERNGAVVPRAKHEVTAIAEGDAIEIVHFVGGG